MKIIVSFSLNIFLLFNACAQQKFDKPPKSGNMKLESIKPTNLQKGHLVLNLGELKQKEDGLYCWEVEGKCSVIDGKITLYSHSIAKGDNASVTERLYAEGEFLEGKYEGVWKYFDEDKKIIKEEKWRNGKLIYRKDYK